MGKNTIENLHQTINSKISTTSNADELFEVKAELKEWIEWLNRSKKISRSQYTDLNKSITEKIKRRENEIEEKAPIQQNTININRIIYPLILIFFSIVLILVGFYYVYRPSQSDESAISAGTIPFRGTLKNAEGTPIDTKTDVLFRLYAQQNSGDALYEGKCIGTNGITPDFQGEFTVILGSDCGMEPIPEAILSNEVLFLGVTVATGEEISPRYRILSSTYSQNSAQVSGKSVGTGENNIPYLDENATMLIDATNPLIKATSGEFVLEGLSLSLKTSGGGEGNIMIQPDAGGYTLIPSGSVGIGVFEPSSKLEVVGLEPYNPIVNIKNISIEDSEHTKVMTLGLSTPSTGEYSKFISFQADVSKEEDGTEVGSIRLNNEGVSYETAGADFAEYFELNSSVEYKKGTIVSLTERGVGIARKNEVVVGAISTTAGFIGNVKPNTSRSHLVGLIGQIDVLVTNENGRILRGDRIGIGTVPGYGVVSDSTNIVGYALEDMDITTMQSKECPPSLQSTKDVFGNPIKCGLIKILLRPN